MFCYTSPGQPFKNHGVCWLTTVLFSDWQPFCVLVDNRCVCFLTTVICVCVLVFINHCVRWLTNVLCPGWQPFESVSFLWLCALVENLYCILVDNRCLCWLTTVDCASWQPLCVLNRCIHRTLCWFLND